VRGSVPAPLTGAQVEEKIRKALFFYQFHIKINPGNPMHNYQFHEISTYGGNTSCVEIIAGNERIACDMGTGFRLLGNALFGEVFKTKILRLTVLLSHLHWDHIQGLPFFGELYLNKESGFKNDFTFYGGTNWQSGVESCLQGQMDPPLFPVSFKEIEDQTAKLQMNTVHDQMSFKIGEAVVKTRKLNHPQETYGYRIEHSGKVFVYATDNEPYDPLYPDPKLLDLAKGADVLVIDCQYTKNIYEGKVGGVPRHGWGHSYPEAVAQIALQAGVKKMTLFHHDPASTDEQIYQMEQNTQNLVHALGGNTKVIAAYEGLEIEL